MDENIIEITNDQDIEVVSSEIIENTVVAEESEQYVASEEVRESIEVEATKEIVIEVEEAIGWTSGDTTSHYSLTGRDEPNQHPISAISGLRVELDEIERLKTVYSDKHNIANYYEWKDAAYDTYGYFVSLVPGTSEITICNGADIFGVSVEVAGFVGGQSELSPRAESYGLIATSGLVDVRCELDVEVGDCVISNTYGYAKKSDSDYGYRVLARENKNGVEYAVIMLGVQADVTHRIGVNLDEIDERVIANEKNIVSAINVANQAYNKVTEIGVSNQEMSDKVDNALGVVDKVTSDVERLETQVSNATLTSTQAKAIAESAATSAESMKNEAVASANDAASKVGELTKTLEPLTTWKDPETGNVGASYLANYIDNGLATKAEIETVEDDLEFSKTAILKNAKSLQSLVVEIDKYSVGEYSTAHGLTLEQASNVLEEGVIYVPITSHKETYSYTDGENTYAYEREFTPSYLYRWGELPNGSYGWITVDKNYSEDKLNTSAPAVYFSIEAPSVGGDFGYWYTNGKTVADGYEPYTLYKWDEDCWVAVATLAGNVNNRSISQIRQTSNEIAIEVSNARNSVAALETRITDTESEVQSLAAWTKDENGEQYNLATIKQTANDAGASIAQVVESVGSDGKVNAASIITAVNNDTSGVIISADRINLKGQVTFESFDEDTRRQIEADSIDIQIWSSRGNIFKSRDVNTVLTCHVFKAGIDITNDLDDNAFLWKKINNNGEPDAEWNKTETRGRAIVITTEQVWNRAVFTCEVTI